MNFLDAATRLRGRYQRTISQKLARRTVQLPPHGPIVSFTFDDFPKSAARSGAPILEEFGARGTFYTAFGLMGKSEEAGEMFEEADALRLMEAGHELGCHTFDHLDAWKTPPATFEASTARNLEALRSLVPSASFRSSSYPISWPSPANKRMAARRFRVSRCGGQDLNAGAVDLNLLHAYFLEQAGDDLAGVRRLIAANAAQGGWLVFATHDVCEQPTRLGCRPAFFRATVEAAKESGAELTTIAGACARLGLIPERKVQCPA